MHQSFNHIQSMDQHKVDASMWTWITVSTNSTPHCPKHADQFLGKINRTSLIPHFAFFAKLCDCLPIVVLNLAWPRPCFAMIMLITAMQKSSGVLEPTAIANRKETTTRALPWLFHNKAKIKASPLP